ncbi:MAG: D-glucuronyl C5-epimerase family protein [Longimicrobiales bacterium]
MKDAPVVPPGTAASGADPAPGAPGRVHVPHSRPGAGIGVRKRLRYWKRIFSAYFGSRKSHLTFWHGTPEVNENATPGQVGEYWQPFAVKADYPGQYDANRIPMLDYHGHVGLQYNPIAIAQYGLGNYNRWVRDDDPDRKARFLEAAGWMVDNLEPNAAGVPVWKHHFDWEYRTPMPSGWYSALSQGQGLSLLVRAHAVTGDDRYLTAAHDAFRSFLLEMEEGGVIHTDAEGVLWFEETIVDPPTHILNGYLWAAWGIYDYWLHTGSADAERVWNEAVRTLSTELDRFDVGYWSLYDAAGTWLPNAASSFYHALHVVQLRVTWRLTGLDVFRNRADRWDRFQQSPVRRRLAWAHKALFKLLFY